MRERPHKGAAPHPVPPASGVLEGAMPVPPPHKYVICVTRDGQGRGGFNKNRLLLGVVILTVIVGVGEGIPQGPYFGVKKLVGIPKHNSVFIYHLFQLSY